MKEWNTVRTPDEPLIPEAISPLGVEPNKSGALWDGRYVNQFCRDVPCSMDNATKVAEVAWEDDYFSSWTSKMGINMHQFIGIPESFLRCFGKGSIMFSLFCPLAGRVLLWRTTV